LCYSSNTPLTCVGLHSQMDPNKSKRTFQRLLVEQLPDVSHGGLSASHYFDNIFIHWLWCLLVLYFESLSCNIKTKKSTNYQFVVAVMSHWVKDKFITADCREFDMNEFSEEFSKYSCEILVGISNQPWNVRHSFYPHHGLNPRNRFYPQSNLSLRCDFCLHGLYPRS